MASQRVAAVDIGASSGRVVVAALQAEGIALEEVARFPNGPVESDGRWVWDFDALHANVLDGLAGAALQGVASFGIDTWACDYGVLDEAGHRIGPVYAYRDPRHADGAARLRTRLPWDEHYAIAGIQDLAFNTVNQLVNDDRLHDGVTVLQVPDLLGAQLTGFRASDVTNASTMALVDPRTRDWSPVLLEAAGIPASVLLPLSEPGAPRGRALDPRLLGMPLIGVGTHDTASAFAGAPIEDRDSGLIISLGTWALVGFESAAAAPDANSRSLNATHELGVDRTVRVLRNVSGMWLFEECRRVWGAADGRPPAVPELVAAMHGAPAFGAGFDVDAAVLAPPGQSPQSIGRLLVGHWDGSRGAVVRAIFESLVARLALRAQEMERLSGRSRPTIHVVGGASRIEPLMQWLADATGKTVVAGPAEATAIGNAIVQWICSGVLRDLTQARALIRTAPEIRTYQPKDDGHKWQAFAARIEEGQQHG